MHNDFLRKPNLPNNNYFCKWVIFSSSFVNSMILELVVLDWKLLTNKLYQWIYFCDMFPRWTQEGYIICISHRPLFKKMTRQRAIVRWILLNLTNNKSIRHQLEIKIWLPQSWWEHLDHKMDKKVRESLFYPFTFDRNYLYNLAINIPKQHLIIAHFVDLLSLCFHVGACERIV
jgi:hypothetical protein